MVPTPSPPLDYGRHSEEVRQRFASLMRLVPGLTHSELDVLAGMQSVGHARQIAEGKVPGAPKAARFAEVFGATGAWLLFGVGRAPSGKRARILVAEARGKHVATLTPTNAVRKRSVRSASANRDATE